jgi:hypothetical protein
VEILCKLARKILIARLRSHRAGKKGVRAMRLETKPVRS